MSVLRPQRRLFLHLSALSDAEYTVYVDALRDLLDDGGAGLAAKLPDDELERKQVGVREVRAWMKGRFRDLGAGEIDKVLQLFAPQMVHKELSGGQLLAALRLLMHARRGGDVNEGGVFVQADPSSPSSSQFPFPFSASSITTEASFPMANVPTTALNTTNKTRTNPFSPDPQLQDIKGHDSAHSVPLPPVISPFLATSSSHPPPAKPSESSKSDLPSPRRASLSSAPPIPPASSKPRIDGVGESGVRPGTTNPFLQRAKTHSGALQSGRTPPLPPRKPAHISNRNAANPPPPVPLKPAFPAPVSPGVQANVSGNSGSSSSNSNQLNSGSPPLLPHHRVTPLMQQSLLASRAGAMLKRAQGEAERTRVLEVIRSSNGANKQIRTPSTSRSPDKGERRPVPRPPHSAPSSASIYSSYSTHSGYSDARSTNSLEQVAGARIVSRSHTRSPDRVSSRSSSTVSSADEGDITPDSARKMSLSEQFSAPPTHPARRPSGHTPTRPRHVRTPSLQSYHTPTPGTPFSASATSPFHISTSSPPVSPVPSNNNTNAARTMRSLSMHQSSSPTFPMVTAAPSEQTGRISPPLPPPRRRRPDSVQLTPRASTFDTNPVPGSPFTNAFTAALEKHTSRLDLDKDKSRDFRDRDIDREKERFQPHALASLQRTFNSLQARAQPTLARARYKAEAGLAPRRGFVPNGRDYNLAGEAGDRLVGGDDASAGMDPDYEYGGGTSPDDDGELGTRWGDIGDDGEDTIRGRGRGRGRLEAAHERDNLKLPEGEGWAQL